MVGINEDSIGQKVRKIKGFVLDVDGVLTDGSILVNEEGQQWRTFNVQDGYAIQYAVKKGYILIVITGGRSEGVRKRLEGLGVQEVHLGVADKVTLLEQLSDTYRLSLDELLYIGDDIPDLQCMQKVGLAYAPVNAVPQVKEAAHVVSKLYGGQGMVREVIETILSSQGRWMDDFSVRSI